MNKRSIIFVVFACLMTIFSFNGKTIAEVNHLGFEKYPDNSQKEFESVNNFYEEVPPKDYVEFENAKLNIRKKVGFKDVNKILSKVDKYGKARIDGDGIHPKRQMYVFITISENEEHEKIAVFDAETKQKMFGIEE